MQRRFCAQNSASSLLVQAWAGVAGVSALLPVAWRVRGTALSPCLAGRPRPCRPGRFESRERPRADTCCRALGRFQSGEQNERHKGRGQGQRACHRPDRASLAPPAHMPSRGHAPSAGSSCCGLPFALARGEFAGRRGRGQETLDLQAVRETARPVACVPGKRRASPSAQEAGPTVQPQVGAGAGTPLARAALPCLLLSGR